MAGVNQGPWPLSVAAPRRALAATGNGHERRSGEEKELIMRRLVAKTRVLVVVISVITVSLFVELIIR